MSWEFRGHSDRIKTIDYAQSGEYLASGSDDSTIRIWNIKSGESEKVLRDVGKVQCIALSPNGCMVVGCWETNAISIWDIKTGELILQELAVANLYNKAGVAFSPNGKTLFSGGANRVRLWNCQNARDGEWMWSSDLVGPKVRIDHQVLLRAILEQHL